MRARNVRVALRQKNIQPLPALAFIYRKAYFCGQLIINGQIFTPSNKYYIKYVNISFSPSFLKRGEGRFYFNYDSLKSLFLSL
jgi:hypothetical protein